MSLENDLESLNNKLNKIQKVSEGDILDGKKAKLGGNGFTLG